MKRILTILAATLLLTAAMAGTASASSYDSVAEELSAIGVFRGTAGGFELDRAPTRSEAAIMLVRLYGAEDEAKAAYEAGEISMPFTDVSETAAPSVAWLYSQGITNGTSATTYAPNDTLTWAAALKLLLVSNGDLKAADATGADWSKNAIAKAAELGLVAADLDGAKAISRLEFCQVAAKLNKLAESKTESKFTDCADGYVMALVDAKVISGMTETTFEPAASLTRAQIAKILYQLNLIEK